MPVAYQPAPPPQVKRKRGGCLGCFIPLIVIVALLAGGLFLLTSAANAAVPVPAQLLVVTPAASLVHGGAATAAKSGTLIHEGDGVRTDARGRAVVQFSDGSVTRVAPNSEITLDSAKFNKNGSISNVTMTQVAGRTLSTVEHLVGGNDTFKIGGHNATAQVRGTRWEFIVIKGGQTILKVYVGVVRLEAGGKQIDVGANKQITVEANGTVGTVTILINDPNDPFTLWLGSEDASGKNGSTRGTASTSYSNGPVTSGQPQSQPDYGSAGGDLVGDLIYPGSNMQLQITDPSGKVWSADGGTGIPGRGRLVEIVIANGPPGVYKVKVVPLDVPAPGEDFSVTLSTRVPCKTGIVDAGGQVRHVYAASDIVNALSQSGVGKTTVTFGKVSSGGSSVSFSGGFAGAQINGRALVYASGTGLGVTLTAVNVQGIDVTGQLLGAIANAGGKNLDNLDVGFIVDKVYTCSAGADTAMVVEGHH